ncbi:8-amino-7-oxononanoate synthase [PVC group bacterium]|nr:8-amino-7-oxononanoate synthase [PVC group bacterium]
MSKSTNKKKIDTYVQEIESLRNSGSFRRLRVIESTGTPYATIDEQKCLNFSSNDYLGFLSRPELQQAAIKATQTWGTGTGSSRLVSGSLKIHQELENLVAHWKGTPSALILNSGYTANTTLIPVLAGRHSGVFCDRLSHASIIDGCFLSRAKCHRYRHNDMDHLKWLLNNHPYSARRVIFTESIFSMNGDEAPLGELVRIAKDHDTILVVDEAHANGIYGAGGAGKVEEYGLVKDVDFQVGTFGKALGSFGAYVACPHKAKELLVNKCRGLIYSTSLPPSVINVNICAVHLVMTERTLREDLIQKSLNLRRWIQEKLIQTCRGASQIIPLILGKNKKALFWSEELLKERIFVTAIRPPTVPEGTSRLRISLSALHTQDHIERLKKALLVLAQLDTKMACAGSRKI